jgi:GT2 family glycosyltransferase
LEQDLLQSPPSGRNGTLGDISIIVVNWNGEQILESCLSSLAALSNVMCEIILVDNASTDSSVSLARAKFPEVTIIRLDKNEGFAGGNARGVKASSAEYIALVNNDARVNPDWLARLIDPMVRDVRVGICASKLIFTENEKLNSAGDGVTTAAVGFNRGLGQSQHSYSDREFVFGACGAAVLYRRRMLEEIGFLDEDFFLYDEDTDLNFRAQLAGWKCVYVPTAVAYHKANATAGRLSDTHVYYHSRNLEFVWIKNMPLGLMLRFLLHKIFQEFGSFCYLCLRHGKWRAYFRAKRDALKMLPKMWTKRQVIQARRRVSNSYVRSLMTSMFSLDFARQKLRQMIQG